MKRFLTAYVVAVLLTVLVFPIIAFAADGDNIFENSYSEDNTNAYLSEICKVDKSKGAIILDKRIEAIVKESDRSNAPKTKHLTITKDGISYTKDVTDDAYRELVTLGRDVYDRMKVKQRIEEMGSSVNVEADTGRASVMLSGLQPLISLIVGILAYLVVLGMTLFTAMDICFITMPVFRNRVEEMKQSGNAAMVKYGKDGEPKLRWVSDEAQYAVITCTVDSGRNPLTVYLQKRIWAHIMVAIVIYILLTGNIQMIVNIAINFVSGILDILSDLGR